MKLRHRLAWSFSIVSWYLLLHISQSLDSKHPVNELSTSQAYFAPQKPSFHHHKITFWTSERIRTFTSHTAMLTSHCGSHQSLAYGHQKIKSVSSLLLLSDLWSQSYSLNTKNTFSVVSYTSFNRYLVEAENTKTLYEKGCLGLCLSSFENNILFSLAPTICPSFFPFFLQSCLPSFSLSHMVLLGNTGKSETPGWPQAHSYLPASTSKYWDQRHASPCLTPHMAFLIFII